MNGSCHSLSFLNSNEIFELFYLGFRAVHSTETALLKLTNDLLLPLDSGDNAVLILLDLFTCSDAVLWIGLSVCLLCVSLLAHLSCGVPQGSILGPVLFCSYQLLLVVLAAILFHFISMLMKTVENLRISYYLEEIKG